MTDREWPKILTYSEYVEDNPTGIRAHEVKVIPAALGRKMYEALHWIANCDDEGDWYIQDIQEPAKKTVAQYEREVRYE